MVLHPTILPSVTKKSDHNIVLLKPTCSRPKVNGFHKITKRRSSDPNCKALLAEALTKFNWNWLYNLQSGSEMVEDFYSAILALLDKYLAYQLLSSWNRCRISR